MAPTRSTARPRHEATIGRRVAGLVLVCAVLFGLATLVGFAAERPPRRPVRPASSTPPGTLVEIPAAIPHEAGDMVDSRIVPDLRWIAARYPIFITDGYSGPLADGEHDRLRRMPRRQLRPPERRSPSTSSRRPKTRRPADRTGHRSPALALWAEPEQEKPVPPFRWVGYEGDAGHGCGNHLHLSWNHAPAKPYELAEWVEVFPVAPGTARKARRKRPRRRPPRAASTRRPPAASAPARPGRPSRCARRRT